MATPEPCLWTHSNAVDIYFHLCKEYQRQPDECDGYRAVWRNVRGVRKVVLYDRDYTFGNEVRCVAELSGATSRWCAIL